MSQLTTKKLNISDELDLPFEFLKRHTLALGEAGSGKSYFIGVFCEELSKNDVPFIVVDTQNANLGLLTLPNTHFVDPLNQELSAEQAGTIVANTNLNVIIKNPPKMNLSEYRAFVNRFIREYILLEQKALRILIVDECHLHAPRSALTEDSEILTTIATSFRSEGLFLTSVTQRIVELNTTIVNQSPNKVFFRVTGYNDAMRLKDILKLKLDKKESEELVKEVQHLETGECLIISNIDLDAKSAPKTEKTTKEKTKVKVKAKANPDEKGEEFHHVRVLHPKNFKKDSFKTIDLGEGIKAVIGRPKRKKVTRIQKYMLPKAKFKSREKAKKWVAKHDHEKALEGLPK